VSKGLLDAGVYKEGNPHADKGGDRKQVFIADVLYTDEPY